VESEPTSPIVANAARKPASTADLSYCRRVMAILWTVVIMALCWLPRTIVKVVEDESSWFKVPNLDKVIHFSIFVLFSILWTRVRSSRRAYVWIMLGGIALGVITEIGQSVPIVNREPNFGDFAADVVAVALGLVLAARVEPLFQALEARLFRRTRDRAIPDAQTTATTNVRP
jgi:hypothetical protein